MASSESTYDERLGLVDCFEEYKQYFSQQHYKLLVHEALEGQRGGVGKLKYVLALARRCKTGAVSAELLSNNVDKEYSLTPPPQDQTGREEEGKVGGQQKGGGEGEGVEGYEDIDTEVDEADHQSGEEQKEEGEEKEEEEEEEEGSVGVLEIIDTAIASASDLNRKEHGNETAKKGGRGKRRLAWQGPVDTKVQVVDMHGQIEGDQDKRQEQKCGEGGHRVEGQNEAIAEIVDADDEENKMEEMQQKEGDERQVPHASKEVNEILETYKRGFFRVQRWGLIHSTGVLSGEGCWLAKHDIQQFRTTTHGDLVRAMPKPMMGYDETNPLRNRLSRYDLKRQERSYQLCRKVAVSFDGKIYRATDEEILAALAETKGAPSIDAATYVKAVQEVLRRSEERKALKPGSG